MSNSDVPLRSELLRVDPASSKSKSWPKVASAAAICVLAAVAYLSWRHYQLRESHEPGRVMLAVLPFQNLTGDPGKEYLVDGLIEETISQLGRLNPEQLGVIARTSVMGYKHKDERLDEIGRNILTKTSSHFSRSLSRNS